MDGALRVVIGVAGTERAAVILLEVALGIEARLGVFVAEFEMILDSVDATPGGEERRETSGLSWRGWWGVELAETVAPPLPRDGLPMAPGVVITRRLMWLFSKPEGRGGPEN